MANNYISLKNSFDNANRFVKELLSTDPNQTIKYVFMGNSNPYANLDSEIFDIMDTQQVEKSVWDTMFVAKKLTGNDIQLVIPRLEWQSNTHYKQFDDTVNPVELLTYSANNDIAPMYVMNTQGNVYKCLSNNSGALSTVEPTGDFSSANGFISTPDSFIWKFLYNVKPTSKYLTAEWIPAPTSINAVEYSTGQSNLVDGTIASIVVMNPGYGYVDSNVAVNPYTTGTNIIVVANTQYVFPNMYVEGDGIIPDTYVTAVNQINRQITLSLPVTSNGNNEISLKTRIYIEGDGLDVEASPVIQSSNISKIRVTSIGGGYTRANVYIYGTGTGAEARAIISPKFGHGFNPARELGANHVISTVKFGDVDSTEDGLISVDTSFRQYGLLSNPHKYGEDTPITLNTANTFITQTLDLTLLPGSLFQLNELVYQGSSANSSTFSGRVHAQNAGTNIVKLINIKGTPSIGGLLKGNTVSRVVSSVKQPDLYPYSGDILYVQNIPATSRVEGQAEIIKLIIKF
jgi:hypothetical protein